MSGFFNGFGQGGVGPIGGASGPAVSGGSPVFQVAAGDPGSVLHDQFFGATLSGGNNGMHTNQVLTIAALALIAGIGLKAAFGKS